MITLTPLQQKTVDDAKAWFEKKESQYFVIHGYAGTGKSTIVRYIIEALNLEKHVAYVTFTGKASLVLNQKGCPATTIHKLIYKTINETVKGVKRTRFVKLDRLNPFIRLIILDEWSMPNDKLIKDLSSYNIPILALGDPAQLPPIGEPNRFYKQCDAFLDEIHRQAEGNPIIYLSMLARQHKEIPLNIYSKDVCVINKKHLRDISLMQADQIICGKNATCHTLNERLRELKHGAVMDRPMLGDKLICLKNNWNILCDSYPLINGMIGYAKKITAYDDHTDTCQLDFNPEFMPKEVYYGDLMANLQQTKMLGGQKFDLTKLKKDENAFDYGYAITCHRSQGSSFNKLIVFEEVLHYNNYEEHFRWLYTAITRAEKQLVLVKNV